MRTRDAASGSAMPHGRPFSRPTRGRSSRNASTGFWRRACVSPNPAHISKLPLPDSFSGSIAVLTIFTIPKPFEGHIDVIQRNALESWCRLDAQVEVILCGDDPGVAEAAQDLGMKHLGVLPCTDYGTPLLDEAFRQVLGL